MASQGTPMYVIKRDGSRASVSFDKITSRITKLCYGLDPKVSTTTTWLYRFSLSFLLNVRLIHCSSSFTIVVCRSSRNRPKSHPGSLSRRNHCRTRRTRSSNRCILRYATSRLLHPRGTYLRFQFTQNDLQILFGNHPYSLPLQTPQDERTSTIDFPRSLWDRHES